MNECNRLICRQFVIRMLRYVGLREDAKRRGGIGVCLLISYALDKGNRRLSIEGPAGMAGTLLLTARHVYVMLPPVHAHLCELVWGGGGCGKKA